MADTYAQRMRQKLEAAFMPARLDLVDESHKHAGHAGARPEGETHFRLVIVSDAFTGLGRIDRQRRIYDLLADELAERVHALSIRAMTPTEADNQ